MEIYVDGTYQPLARPAIRATDRGLRQGEAVYEGVKIVARRPLFLEEHLERLAASADALELPMPWSVETLRPILSRLLGVGGEVTGMARLLRGYALAAMENVPLWHERDISHSSVERVIAPDATIALDFMLRRMTYVIRDLCVYPENMRRNLEKSGGTSEGSVSSTAPRAAIGANRMTL